jgi:hypothetical protein
MGNVVKFEKKNAIHGFICGPRIYEWNGIYFEYGYCGPWPLKKNGEIKARAGKKFFDSLDAFFKLSDKEKEAFRVGGGCIRF